MRNKGDDLQKQRIDCIKNLLEAGANPELENNNTFWTPVHWMAYYGDKDCVSLLLEKGA